MKPEWLSGLARLDPRQTIKACHVGYRRSAPRRRAGIPVASSATSYLFVSFASVNAFPDLLCSLAVSLELQQIVVLVRDTTITTIGTTRHQGGLGVVATGPPHSTYLRGMLVALVEEFIRACRAQNAKP